MLKIVSKAKDNVTEFCQSENKDDRCLNCRFNIELSDITETTMLVDMFIQTDIGCASFKRK